jgi:hypothetical protein
MSPTSLFRFSGFAAILSGLFLIVDTLVIELFLPETALTNTVGYSGLVIGVFALIGVYFFQRTKGGYFGDISFMVNFLGLLLIVGVMFFINYIRPFLSQEALQALLAGPTRAVLLVSAQTFLLGVLLFGISIFRAGVFPRLAAVLYIVGFVIFSLEPLLPDAIVRTAQVLGSISVIWFGYTLLSTTQAISVAQLARSQAGY